MIDVGKDLQTAYDDGYQQGKRDAQRWIPCKERLPDEAKEYQVTFASCFDGQPNVGISFYFLGIGWEIEEEIYAWMPLPDPYKEETDD